MMPSIYLKDMILGKRKYASIQGYSHKSESFSATNVANHIKIINPDDKCMKFRAKWRIFNI